MWRQTKGALTRFLLMRVPFDHRGCLPGSHLVRRTRQVAAELAASYPGAGLWPSGSGNPRPLGRGGHQQPSDGSAPVRGPGDRFASLVVRALKNRGQAQPQLAPRRGGQQGRRGPTVPGQMIECCSRDRAESAAPARSAVGDTWDAFGFDFARSWR